jgi:cellulose synthase/poly-beta-1,6-N-acetylglucosamine synthase-like glycosyltransferase
VSRSASSSPLVTFVVPCYRLAHLLGECVQSILAQDFDDFEVLIMDDCSPDDTPAVAASFDDPRVRYVRHPENLGNLRNFNAGIGLARGRYIWLISADDRLWRPYVLSRLVAALEANPQATFAFCPVRRFSAEGDLGLYGSVGPDDRVWRGHDFFRRLLDGNIVPAASAIARREAYEKVGRFPLNLPYAGDWSMWAAFAFQGDVIYLAEPMVQWRFHDLNMTKIFKKNAAALVSDEIEVLWLMKSWADAAGQRELGLRALEAICGKYAQHVGRWAAEEWAYGLTVEAFEQSLGAHTATDAERSRIRAATYSALGDGHFEAGRSAEARSAYRQSLSSAPMNGKALAKLALLGLGAPGNRMRRAFSR